MAQSEMPQVVSYSSGTEMMDWIPLALKVMPNLWTTSALGIMLLYVFALSFQSFIQQRDVFKMERGKRLGDVEKGEGGVINGT